MSAPFGKNRWFFLNDQECFWNSCNSIFMMCGSVLVVRRPPLRTIAEIAAVSEPTVSRVLNGRTGVAPATRDRVMAALESLGFSEIPSPRHTRRNVVGIVASEFTNPVFATFTHLLGAEFAKRGLIATVIESEAQTATETQCVDEFVASNVDGIVFIGGEHAEQDQSLDRYVRLIEHGLPIVLVNGKANDLACPRLYCDEQAGAVSAVTHLQQLGHRRIGCLLGSSRFIPTRRFIEGWRSTMAGSGLESPDELVVESVFTFEGGRAGATRLLERGVTGIIAGNDLMALGAIHAASSAGISVPSGLSVVGYDGTEFTTFTSPPLTTLRQPFEDMSSLAAEALTSEIVGDHRFREQYVFEPVLLARASTGPAERLASMRSA